MWHVMKCGRGNSGASPHAICIQVTHIEMSFAKKKDKIVAFICARKTSFRAFACGRGCAFNHIMN